METIFEAFIKAIGDGQVEIYNEFSLQHELGIYLRQVYGPPHKVQFESMSSYSARRPIRFWLWN